VEAPTCKGVGLDKPLVSPHADAAGVTLEASGPQLGLAKEQPETSVQGQFSALDKGASDLGLPQGFLSSSSGEESIEQDEYYSSGSSCEDRPDKPTVPPQFVQLHPMQPATTPLDTPVEGAQSGDKSIGGVPSERLRRIRAMHAKASEPFITSYTQERAKQPSSYAVKQQQLRVAQSASHNEAARHVTGALVEPSQQSVTPTDSASPMAAGATHAHRVWTRDKSEVIEPEQMKPLEPDTGHRADTFSLTPNLALQWQQLTLAQFKSSTNHGLLDGFDRQAWSEFNKTMEKVWNMAELEKKVLASGSVFAANLAKLADQLAEPIQPTVYNLPNVLRDLSDDEHPHAAQVYVNLSRGVDVLPAQIQADMPHTAVENYPIKTELLRKQMPAEIQRHFEKGFAMKWSDIRQRFGVTEQQPKNVLPVNVIEKNELVCRVTFDPSNSNNDEVPSVNEFADTLPKPTCIYPTFKHGCAAMYKQGWGVRADDEDAFLNHSLKPRAMLNCGFVDPRSGEMCALTKLGLGFQQSPAIQQDSEVAQVRALRRRLRRLGLQTTGPDPDYHRKFPYVKPNTVRDSLTAALPYCDDIGMWLTTLAAAWFATVHLLLQKKEWGVKLGMKPGKTDPPQKSFEWIGYWFMMRSMQVGFTEKKLNKMKRAVEPFSSLAVETPIMEQAQSTLGLLDHGSNVILLGKAYFHVMREQVTAIDLQAKTRRAAKKTPFRLSTDLAHSMDMWYMMLTHINVRSAVIGVRRQTFPYPGYSDASFSRSAGWCYHCMGIIAWGKWPASWLDKLGPHSEFAEIFITECELWAILGLCRRMFPKARGMKFCGLADNLSTVHMLNKLSTRSARCRLIVTEILWLAVVWDVEISYEHIPTDKNVLSDFGTRQEDKAFRQHLKTYVQAFPEASWHKAMSKFPAQKPARPELVPYIPVAGESDFYGMPVDPDAMGNLLPEWMTSGIINKDRSAALRAFSQG
jgi:hypothetical protein